MQVLHEHDTEVVDIRLYALAVIGSIGVVLVIDDHRVARRTMHAIAQIQGDEIDPIPLQGKTVLRLDGRSEAGNLDQRTVQTLFTDRIRVVDTIQLHRQREIQRHRVTGTGNLLVRTDHHCCRQLVVHVQIQMGTWDVSRQIQLVVVSRYVERVLPEDRTLVVDEDVLHLAVA